MWTKAVSSHRRWHCDKVFHYHGTHSNTIQPVINNRMLPLITSNYAVCYFPMLTLHKVVRSGETEICISSKYQGIHHHRTVYILWCYNFKATSLVIQPLGYYICILEQHTKEFIKEQDSITLTLQQTFAFVLAWRCKGKIRKTHQRCTMVCNKDFQTVNQVTSYRNHQAYNSPNTINPLNVIICYSWVPCHATFVIDYRLATWARSFVL